MTTDHHTPHPFGAPVTAAEFNGQLGELDAAIGAAIAAGFVDAATTLDAQAASGQKVLPVASTVGFIVGDSVWVGTVGSGLQETGVLASISAGVSLTLVANLASTHAIGEPVSRSPAEIVDARGSYPTLGSRLVVFEGLTAYNVLAYGAVADGATDDSAAIQAAEDAAALTGGRIIAPPGHYKMLSAVDLREHVDIYGHGPAATFFEPVPGVDAFRLPTAGGFSNFGLYDLNIEGGRRGLSYEVTGASQYISYLAVKRVQMNSQTEAGCYLEGAVEELDFEFDRFIATEEGIGFWKVNVDGASTNYIDKSSFKDIHYSGKNGLRLEGTFGNTNTWDNPTIQSTQEHGAVIDGGWRSLIFRNMNTEANGQSGKSNRTTGSITTGTAALTLASATGYAIGDTVTVAGAGAGGLDLTAIASNVVGSVVTLDANASTTVAAAKVTNAEWDDVHFDSSIATPADIAFEGGMLGGETIGHLRYAINGSGAFHLQLLNTISLSGDIPFYIPQRSGVFLSTEGTIRWPGIAGDIIGGLHLTNDLRLGAEGTLLRSGTGSPESVVTAPVGSLYLRTNGGAGTSLYIKESGAGNTGWVAK